MVSPNCESSVSSLGQVNGSSEDQPCMDFSDAMDNLNSDSIMLFEPGTYTITRSHAIHGLRNVSFIGASENGVYLSCEDRGGLGFVNITDLTIANLSLNGCGIHESSFFDALITVNQTIDLWTRISPTLHVTLFLADCTNIFMTNVRVNGTRGLGMLAINVLGSSFLSNLRFTHNRRQGCIQEFATYPFNVTEEVLNQTGGGAYFLFHDYFNNSYSEHPTNNSLVISDSYFANNADCSFSALTHLNYKYYNKDMNRFTLGAGGGLSIIYAHSAYSITSRIEFTTFYQNDARYGAGAYIATFADVEYPNNVIFDNCTFQENGLRSFASTEEYCRGGGGLAILTDILKPSNELRSIASIQDMSILAFKTQFIRNVALIEGGGIFAYSFTNSHHRVNTLSSSDYFSIKWNLTDCSFRGNQARLDSAASFNQRVFHPIDGIVLLHLQSIEVRGNGLNLPNLERLESSEVPCAFLLVNIAARFRGESVFADNGVTAMHITSGVVFVTSHSTLLFEGNMGKRGGAMYIEGVSSGIFVFTNSTISYQRNTAAVEGGAIFYEDPLFSSNSLQPFNIHGCLIDTPTFIEIDLFSSGSRLEFCDNTAPTGSMIFGTTFESCPWAELVRAKKGRLLVELHERFSSTFSFDVTPNGTDQVSTYPAYIKVDAPDELIPGEMVEVNISAFDKFNEEILAIVGSELPNDNSIDSILSESGFWYTVSNTTTLRVMGTQNQALNLSFFTYINVVTKLVPIQVRTCPAGFVFDNDMGRCECAEIFEHDDEHSDLVRCDSDTVTYSTMFNIWVGVDTENLDSNDSNNLIIHECFQGYCLENSTFRPPNYDAQCAYRFHRSGILCGGCEAGYSAVFGSNRCLICSNYYLFTVFGFLAAGIVLFAVILLLEITSDKGWINAVFFFCNALTLYSFVLSPNTPFKFILLPAHLLSLQIGFELCFYNEMTALSRCFVQFLFPLYLYILMFIYKVLANRCTFPLSKHYSPVQTFVTITLMTYVSILNTCIEILSLHVVHTVKEVYSVRWILDANQLYFRGFHAILGIIAILIVIFYLSFSVLCFVPSILYKHKLFKSFKPFYDAFFAPFEVKYRFWLGVRIAARAFLVLFARTFNTYTSLLINLVMLLLLLHVQTNIKPYKSKWLNAIDSLLIVNLIIMYIRFVVSSLLPPNLSLDTGSIVFYSIFAATAYVIIIGIFGFYIDARFPAIRKKLLCCVQVVVKKMRNNSDNEVTSQGQPGDVNTIRATPMSNTAFDQPGDHEYNRFRLNRERARLEVNGDLDTSSTTSDVPYFRDSILESTM